MERWDEACRKQSVYARCELRTDGVKCADCGTQTVWVEDVGETKKMVCGSHGHTFWFVRNGGCKKCACEWTDSSKSQKQLRSADEAATVTVCCMNGCTVKRSD